MCPFRRHAHIFPVDVDYCIRAKGQRIFSRSVGFVRRSMAYPLLLLLSCVLILIGRFVTLGLAMTIGAGVIYAIGYRGLVGVSNTHDGAVPILGTLRIWFDVMPTNLIVQTGLAVVILVLGTAQLSRLLRKRRKLLS